MLRTLCLRHSLPISLVNANDEPRAMNSLIEELKKAEVITEFDAKQLRLWAGTRNFAAHGDFDKVTREDVNRMCSGVQDFLAKYL